MGYQRRVHGDCIVCKLSTSCIKLLSCFCLLVTSSLFHHRLSILLQPLLRITTLTLTAETTTGVFLSAEVCSNPAGGDKGPTVPEELGVRGAELLMEEIFRGDVQTVLVKVWLPC